MSQSEFERLEQFVKKLLQKHEELNQQYKTLKQLLVEKEEEIDNLNSQLQSADNERGDISKRVKGIIDQIEEWELSFDQSIESEQIDGKAEEKSAISSDEEPEKEELDESDAEMAEKTAEERQQNLFKVGPESR